LEAGESDGERVLAWTDGEGIWETGREKVAFAADGVKGAGRGKAGLSGTRAFRGAFVINHDSFHL
jgi:hypothetical protein